MRGWLLVAMTCLLCVGTGFAEPIDEGDLADLLEPAIQRFVPEKEQPWRFTFASHGSAWFWQFGQKDPDVHWDFGAKVNMEIARGRGHRTWLGVSYREAAGFGAGQSVTPFDPKQVDTAQHLGWRYAPKPRFEVFTWWSRWCYHEIDVYNRSATFFTLASIGAGTIAPPEASEVPIRARRLNKGQLDGYLMAGPIISGGPISVLGSTSTWQAEATGYLTWTQPLNRTLQVEVRVKWEMLFLSEHIAKRDRHRLDARFYLTAQRDAGGFSLFAGRHFMDEYPMRSSPVDWYVGMGHRF